MTLRYYFNDNEYEYDLEYSQINDYFNRLPDNDLINNLEIGFDNMNPQEQKDIIEDLSDDPKRNLIRIKNGIETSYKPNFKNLIEDDKGWCIDTFIYDNLDQYEDELKDYFEDEAYEEYKDQIEAAEGQAGIEREYWNDIRRGV